MNCGAVAVLGIFALLLITPATYCEEYAMEDAKKNYVEVFDMMFEYESEAVEGRKRRNAIPIGSSKVWPSGVVPFEFSNDFTEMERRTIFQAMEHWETYTCVRFRPKTGSDAYSIRYETGNSGECRSFIGRISLDSQPQTLTLGPGCVFFPTAVHEIGHALGFFHEHSRPDRDEYITVIKDNINPDQIGDFVTIPPSLSNTFNFGYDYASIMHYSPTTFAVAGTEARQ